MYNSSKVSKELLSYLGNYMDYNALAVSLVISLVAILIAEKHFFGRKNHNNITIWTIQKKPFNKFQSFIDGISNLLFTRSEILLKQFILSICELENVTEKWKAQQTSVMTILSV